MNNSLQTKTNENKSKVSSLYRNKLFGTVLLIMGIFSSLIIVHRLAHYVYEYNAEYSPINYGRFNILSFFTVQSNIFVCIYLILMALAVFGIKKAQKIAFNPMVGALVTTYIFVTGLVYCCGIPLGFTPPFQWDTAHHSMQSFIQVYHHMIVPPLMVILWLFPASDKKIPYVKCWSFTIYPLIYSIFSIIRGALFKPTFYPYPFYEPSFFWNMFLKDKPMNLLQAYLLMLPIMLVALMLFVIIAAIFILIHNKIIKD